jgi:hypothetical protein
LIIIFKSYWNFTEGGFHPPTTDATIETKRLIFNPKTRLYDIFKDENPLNPIQPTTFNKITIEMKCVKPKGITDGCNLCLSKPSQNTKDDFVIKKHKELADKTHRVASTILAHLPQGYYSM